MPPLYDRAVLMWLCCCPWAPNTCLTAPTARVAVCISFGHFYRLLHNGHDQFNQPLEFNCVVQWTVAVSGWVCVWTYVEMGGGGLRC